MAFLSLLALLVAAAPDVYPHNCTYKQGGTGSVTRACADKFADALAAKEFGAKCDGTTDDAPALALANTAAVAQGKAIFIGCKLRIASAAGTVAAGLRFEGAGALDLSPVGGSVTITGALTAPVKQIFFTGSGTLTFSAKVAQVVPQWWGAVGDGVADDTAAIQAAITAAQSAGATLFVNRGTYIVKNLSVATALRIEGEGRDIATLKLKALAALDGSPILNVTVAGVSVRHLGFDGNKANQPADGFSDSWAGGANGTGRSYRAALKVFSGINGTILSGLIVEDCLFKNTYGAGIATLDVSHVKARRNKGQSNNFETVFLYSTLGEGSSLPDQDVTNNEILSTGSGDLTVQGNAIVLTRASHSLVAHNLIDTSERNGLKCEACSYTNTIGNTINSITTDNFPCISYQIESTGSVISGNQCSNAGAGITLGYVSPGAGFNGIVIADNTIDTTTGSTQADAITVSALAGGGSGITISGNQARNIVRYCTYFNGGAVTNVVVRGNNCKTTGLTTAGGFQFAADTAGTAGIVIASNVYDLGNAATSAGGVFFNQSAGATVANVSITGNNVITGATHAAYADNANMITSGVFAGNLTDGFASFASTNLLVSDTNAILSHNAWMAPANGRVALTTPITATIYDTRIISNLTTPGPVAVTLPALGTDGSSRILAGHTLLIKDGKGDAATNNITITRGASTTIDGLTTTRVINTNYGSLMLVYDGTNNWSTVALPQIGASTFANLGTPSNGTFYYCSDCTIASPCAALGTGAFAKRLNGVWVCN